MRAAWRAAKRLPMTFTVGVHPLDFFAATTRQPGDELGLVAQLPRRARAGGQKPDQRHSGAGRRRDDARRLSRRARLCRARRAVRRIHGLLRRDPHGSGLPLHRHHHARATRCITRSCTARPSCSIRPTAPTSRRCAPRPRRCKFCKPPCASRSRSISRAVAGGSNTLARLHAAARARRSARRLLPRYSAASCA